MSLPLIAIVGRPNVGKSSFFNAIVGKRASIVSAESGVTRDRVMETGEFAGHRFTLVDTGGVDFDEESLWNKHIREQVDIAIDLADYIIFLVDGEFGIHPDDEEIAKMLRRAKKRVTLAVNKLDTLDKEQTALYDFYKLDIGEPIPVSSTQKRGLGDLLERVLQDAYKPRIEDSGDTEAAPRIAIVGRPNGGKSSIVNKLLGEKRVMVSEISGTTRDTIDTPFRYNGKEYVLTDTAGIRRKRSIEVKTVEHYSVLRSLAAVRNSDFVVLVVDVSEGLTEQDTRLIGYAHENGKPSLVVLNKWDLIEKDTHTINTFRNDLARDLAFMPYFQEIFISAKTGQRIGELMKQVEQILERAKTRVTTGTLNQLIQGFVATTPPPMQGGKRPKFLYSTQVDVSPPTFALFVNYPDAIKSSYLRYLENNLRKSLDLRGTPIKFVLRERAS